MRKFQRAAIVAAAVAGLSTLGVGVSFAGGDHDELPPQLTAVANSSANAVATWGGYYAGPEGHKSSPDEGYGQGAGQGDDQ
ncbi:hypothetical protein SRB17_03530 [Streptomyces sp. RB17]|uniref:hypothetical protein n=1 Tax=Streptomyces sp. RB17 TaxID=2585197 RepID=UPI0012962FE5|nr:hypothetical protein [Streptomyces sp. RB17]MQY32405.1 hypothetical protein [Streptomyces sp. RB17]